MEFSFSGRFNPCFGGNQKSNCSILLYPEFIQISFNPCFGGNQKSNYAWAIPGDHWEVCFNPCFGGNQKSNYEKKGLKIPTFSVSILVLVEIRNQIPIPWKRDGDPRECFNPCFGGNQKSNRTATESGLSLTASFNPCFGGNQKSNVIIYPVPVRYTLCFNPCFGGNQKSNSAGLPRLPCDLAFQSLFWWKSEIKLIWRNERRCPNRVSILVLVEIRNQIFWIARRQRW